MRHELVGSALNAIIVGTVLWDCNWLDQHFGAGTNWICSAGPEPAGSVLRDLNRLDPFCGRWNQLD